MQLKFIPSFLFLMPFSANENKISLPLSLVHHVYGAFSVSNIFIESIDLRSAHMIDARLLNDRSCAICTSRCTCVGRRTVTV